MNDAIKALMIVAALCVYGQMAVNYGYSKGLRAAPEYARAMAQRSSEIDAAWDRITDAAEADAVCTQIRDIVLRDEAAEAPSDPSSPHSD